MSALCKCGTLREKRTAGEGAKFPGRSYFKCESCGAFDWADASPRKLFDTNAGPECKCGKATVQKTVKKPTAPNVGKKFWSCASYPRGCKFFQLCDEQEESNKHRASPRKLNMPSPDRKRKPLPGFASYLSDWKRVQIIEKLMEVDPTKMKRDTGNKYDKLDVVGTWKIGNPVRMQKYAAAKERVNTNSPKVSSYGFSKTLQDTMDQLGADSLDTQAGEVYLLHGTKPENLHGILFEGLDPSMSSNGNFGRGVYFAENAAKTNQYATTDKRWKKDGKLGELHEKIYKGQMHPNNVRYVLVCRVLLGRNVETSNGRTRIKKDDSDGDDNEQEVFTDSHRKALAPLKDGTTPSSLVGLPGELTRDFREFVVFNADQVFVEYLVAYKEVRSLCDCGMECLERTVTRETENRGRKIHFCGRLGHAEACKFMQILPICDCGDSASVKTSHSASNPNRKYYSCYKKYGRCDFFQWQDDTGSNSAASSPHKRART